MRYWILLFLWVSGAVCSDTSLWRVSSENSELFIGGTIHVLSKTDYPLPVEFEKAYQKSEKLVLETDIAGLETPEMQMQLLQRMMYNDGSTLQSALSNETFKALENYCHKQGIPLEPLLLFKPGMVAISLMMMELQKLGLSDTGVDLFFNGRATQDGKLFEVLETAEVQLELLETMGTGYENELILSTLKDLKDLPAMMANLKRAWRAGDLPALERLGIEPMLTDYPDLYQDLLLKRNNAWMPKIEAMLSNQERELILVGALHLVGANGILAQLQARGYKIEPF